MDGTEELENVTRVEIIDHRIESEYRGRVFVSGIDPDMKVELSYQDNGKTVKIFLSDKEDS